MGKIPHEEPTDKDFTAAHIQSLQATADKRLELLRRENANRVLLGRHCIFCGELPKKIRGSEEFLFDFEDRHTDDCELSRELQTVKLRLRYAGKAKPILQNEEELGE